MDNSRRSADRIAIAVRRQPLKMVRAHYKPTPDVAGQCHRFSCCRSSAFPPFFLRSSLISTHGMTDERAADAAAADAAAPTSPELQRQHVHSRCGVFY